MRKRHWQLSKLNLFRKETKVRTLNFKTFFKVAAVLAVLLTSSYFLFFNNTQSYETGIAQTKHSDYQITPSFIECRVKIQ
jgi:hypothetical protein